MKDTEELVVGNIKFRRIGKHRISSPYLNVNDLNGNVIAMPEKRDLMRLRRMIDYVLNDRKKSKPVRS